MNAATMHHQVTRPPSLNRFLGWSFALHVLALIALSITLSNTIRVLPAPAIQVRLVGVPQPKAQTQPKFKPEEVRTQDSAAPKEPPPDMKNIPPSKATTRLLQEEKPTPPQKENPVEAQKRPPVLDKTPREKKVVKNDLSAKVVKDPEDYLKALNFVDKLEKSKPTPTKTAAVATPNAPAGEGPQIQLNQADEGVISAIRQKVEENWLIPPGLDTRGLQVTVAVSIAADGNITSIHITQGSGQPYFDNSLLRAIRKAVPLPIPADKYDKFKELELGFEPPAQ